MLLMLYIICVYIYIYIYIYTQEMWLFEISWYKFIKALSLQEIARVSLFMLRGGLQRRIQDRVKHLRQSVLTA